MTKKNILNIIIAFSFIAIFIYLSIIFFGSPGRNVSITALLLLFIIFLVDFKENTQAKIALLLFLFIGSIICACISNLNIYISLLINIGWIYILSYICFKNFKMPVYLPMLFIYLVNLIFKTSYVQITSSYLVLLGLFIVIIAIRLLIKDTSKLTINNYMLEHYRFKNNLSMINLSIALSIITAIIYFAITYFNLTYGSWLLFTIIGLLIPYNSTKFGINLDKNIFIGSLIGAIRILIVATIVPLYPVRLGIMGIGFYLFVFSKKYRVRAMGALMFTLSMTQIHSAFNGFEISSFFIRFIYIIIGFIIALILNKLILRKIIKTV